jgi:hypothetical protein
MSLEGAIEAHRDAQREAAYWTRVCAAWTALCGPGVWREGHPADREKLRQRRRWRRAVANSAETLRYALAVEPPGGHA